MPWLFHATQQELILNFIQIQMEMMNAAFRTSVIFYLASLKLLYSGC